jgi:hypothetical protein
MTQQNQVLTTRRLRVLRTFEASYVPEPWVVALLNYIKHRARKRGEGLTEIESYHIEAAIAFQGYRCPAANTEFVFPEEAELQKCRGYLKWLRSLEPADRRRAPVPVRAERDEPWGPGNIILLTERWAAIYEDTGGSVEFHDAIVEVGRRIRENQFTIMTAESYPDALVAMAEAKIG